MAYYAKLYYSRRTVELTLVENFFEWQMKTAYTENDMNSALRKSNGRGQWAGELIHEVNDKIEVMFTFYTFNQLYEYWNKNGLFLL